MDERDDVEQQQQFQSTMKKEKKNSKTENRFKSKFANSAMEKARAFFRSLERKHRHKHEQPATNIMVNTSSSNEDHQKKDVLLIPIPLTTNISTSRIPRVEKINPRDMIVHRVIHNDETLPSNYFQQKYKQYFKPSLLIPKQYYHDILNKRYSNYSTSYNRHSEDLYSHSPVSTLSSHFRYPSFDYSIIHNRIPSYQLRPFAYREIESSYNERIPLPSSSMLTWNQCVRRLNREYKSTVDALEQAKQCLEQIHYIDSTSREKKNLSINETKKSANVTFYLPSSPISNRSLSISNHQTFPSVKFSKPKLVKPLQLNTFVSTKKLEPVLTIIENEEKFDSIANIIQKFNNLSSSSLPIHKEQAVSGSSIANPRVHFKPSITTYELKQVSDPSPPIPLSSELVLTKEEDQSQNSLQDEETTYTIETFYKNTENNFSFNNPNIVVIQENTTEEKFNLAHQENQTNQLSRINNTSSSDTKSPILLNNKNMSSATPLKKNNKSMSHIPKRLTTISVSHSKQPSKIISSSSKLKPPSATITNNTTTSLRKAIGHIKTPAQIQNQRKNNPFPSSSTAKKQPLISTNESQNRTVDPTSSNRVKSTVPITVSLTHKRPSSRPSISKTPVQRK